MARANPTRNPLPPPFPIGTHLRCIEGADAYVPRVEQPQDIKAQPWDWVRISGRGLEVTIDSVREGARGTGRQLHDEEDWPVVDVEGKPILEKTRDGCSLYHVVHGTSGITKKSGQCIYPSSAHRWQVLPAPLLVQAGDFIEENGARTSLGRVLASGAKTFDVIWFGGSTTRYRHGDRDIRIVPAAGIDKLSYEHLTREAEAALRERRTGARIRRGTVSPRR